MNDRRGLPSRTVRRWIRAKAVATVAALAAACVTVHTPSPSGGGRASNDEAGGGPVAVAPAYAGSPPPAAPSGSNRSTVAAKVTGASETPAAPAEAPGAKELPRGGRVLFPSYRLVGFCGTPGAPALGELQGNLNAKVKELEAKVAQYAPGGRTLLPVFELIAVVVQSGAGPDNMYRRRVDDSVVDQYLRLARNSKGILLLNIQPGHSDFMTEVQAFERYLKEPDVGVALDPEWAMKPKQRPGVFYGQTTGDVINQVADYLSGIIEQNGLPEKALVFHQVNREVLKDESVLTTHPGVAIIKSVDGLGPMAAKLNTYNYLMRTRGAAVHPGFKLFFDEDTRNGSHLMTPREVLALKPQPEYVMYE